MYFFRTFKISRHTQNRDVNDVFSRMPHITDGMPSIALYRTLGDIRIIIATKDVLLLAVSITIIHCEG